MTPEAFFIVGAVCVAAGFVLDGMAYSRGYKRGHRDATEKACSEFLKMVRDLEQRKN